jgi:hypothetical protein
MQTCIVHEDRPRVGTYGEHEYPICRECAETIEAQDFRLAESRFGGYLDAKAGTITGWLGNAHATVVSVRSGQRTSWGTTRYWRARDAYGRSWYGRASEDGMYTTMCRAKS